MVGKGFCCDFHRGGVLSVIMRDMIDVDVGERRRLAPGAGLRGAFTCIDCWEGYLA